MEDKPEYNIEPSLEEMMEGSEPLTEEEIAFLEALRRLEEEERREKEIRDKIVTVSDFIDSIKTIKTEAVPIKPLWDPFLFYGGVTLMVADPGVGKTSFAYAMIYDLGRDVPFLGIQPTYPIRALVLDYELSSSLIKARWENLEEEGRFPEEPFPIDAIQIFHSKHQAFLKDRDHSVFVSQITRLIEEAIDKFKLNLLVIDSMRFAFDIRDENENPEGHKQMTLLSNLAKKLNIAILLIHHSSKANAPGIRKGSGAFSRVGAVDVCFNLLNYDHKRIDLADPNGDFKIVPSIELEMAKNRYDGELFTWYIEKKEGNFVVIPQSEAPLLIPVAIKGEVARCSEFMQIVLGNSRREFASDIVDRAMQYDFSESTVFRTLKRMKIQGIVKQEYPKWGRYYLV